VGGRRKQVSGTLTLIRHGVIEDTPTGRFYGATDMPLSNKGVLQAERLKEVIDISDYQVVLSSPCLRALQTLQAPFPDAEFEEEETIAEIDFGAWEGLTFEEIAADYPELVGEWIGSESTFAFPEGESVAEFREWVEEAVDIFYKHAREDKNILVFSHSGVIKVATCVLLGIDPEYHYRFSVSNASISVFEIFEDSSCLLKFNDTCHLAGL
jgi:broad specificity phosphatase PhoE